MFRLEPISLARTPTTEQEGQIERIDLGVVVEVGGAEWQHS